MPCMASRSFVSRLSIPLAFSSSSSASGPRASSSSRPSMSSPASAASCSWIGRSRRKKPTNGSAGLDQPVVPVPPPVDDVDDLRLGVAEDEEVVAHELELEHGLLGGHRRDGELLGLVDPRLVLGRLERPCLGRLGSAAGVPAWSDAPLLAVALDLPLEL